MEQRANQLAALTLEEEGEEGADKEVCVCVCDTCHTLEALALALARSLSLSRSLALSLSLSLSRSLTHTAERCGGNSHSVHGRASVLDIRGQLSLWAVCSMQGKSTQAGF